MVGPINDWRGLVNADGAPVWSVELQGVEAAEEAADIARGGLENLGPAGGSAKSGGRGERSIGERLTHHPKPTRTSATAASTTTSPPLSPPPLLRLFR